MHIEGAINIELNGFLQNKHTCVQQHPNTEHSEKAKILVMVKNKTKQQ